MPEESLTDRLRKLVVADPLSPRDQSDQACAARLRIALQLSDDGVALMRMNLKRQNPEADQPSLDLLLREWLHRKGP